MIDQSKVDMLISFGFQEDVARKALKASVLSSSFLWEKFKMNLLSFVLSNSVSGYMTSEISLHIL